MCGICGVVQIGGLPRRVVEPLVLDRMTDLMVHRGPDDRGTYHDAGIALGARRLSIVDLAGGHQPLSNEDGRILAAQNGELYNHVELRVELERDGHRFRSRCDTEILPHLYERDGDRFVERLRGKFGLVVWDEARRRAVIARDRLGIKPIYWARAGDVVVFASELKSVLASGLIAPELDYEAIDAYLALGYVPGPSTPLAGVSKLLPGHRLVVDRRGPRVEAYWSFPEPTGDWRGSDSEAREELLGELEEAVRLRLMSDVPLGAMLSGGLDSSLVVALMARNMTEPVKTFSVGFAEAGEANELEDARRVAAHFGADHHELELSVEDQAVDIAELVWYLDEPLADLSALGFLALSQLASRHVTVALSGQGADELLAGYGRYRNAVLSDRWRRVPGSMRRPLERAAERGPASVRRKARILATDDPVAQAVASKRLWSRELRSTLATGRLAALDDRALDAAVRDRMGSFSGGALQSLLYLDGQLGLVDDMIHYFDRASMAHSLEVRVPFLDHKVVEFCARLPASQKIRGRTTKYALRGAARGLVPDFVLQKRKVGFFSAAVGTWLSGQLEREAGDYLLSEQASYGHFLDAGEVRRLVLRHAEGGNRSHESLILAVLMLEVWLSTFLPNALGAAPVAAPAAATA